MGQINTGRQTMDQLAVDQLVKDRATIKQVPMTQSVSPLVIPVFIPHSGCPHQCAFCNQSIITNQEQDLPDHEDQLPDKKLIQNIVKQYLEYKGKRKYVELAFFGGNFLGLSRQSVVQLLESVKPYIQAEKIHGIRFSTRPDTITRDMLDLIMPYHISAIELGVQSMNDDVLLASRRGHKSLDTINAIKLIQKYPIKIGVQVMVGLPGDNEISLLESTKKLAGLAPDFARIYPLLVLKGSLLEKWYKSGKYTPLNLDDSVRHVAKMYHTFKNADVDIIRMGLQASDMMEDESKVLAGPWHPAFGHLVFSQILYEKVCKKMDLCQTRLTAKKLAIHIHPKSESRLRGDKNTNLKKLKLRYPDFELSISVDETMGINQAEIYEDAFKNKEKWI